MSIIAIVLLVATLFMTANIGAVDDCSKAKTKDDIVFDEFDGENRWYLVQATRKNKNNYTCIYETLSWNDGGSTLTRAYFALRGGKHITDIYVARIADDTAPIVFVNDDDDTKKFTTNIFATDYTSYLVYVTCDIKDSKPLYSVKVFTHKRTPEDAVITQVHKLLKDAGIPDDLITIDQGGCD